MEIYKVGGYKSLIEKIECTRANEKSVWFMRKGWGGMKETRDARHSRYYNYFDTIEEAKGFLTEKLQNEINAAKNRISKAEAKLKELSEY